MLLRLWSVSTLTLAALSLAPSFAHVLEAPTRLAGHIVAALLKACGFVAIALSTTGTLRRG
jgi:hypothetical protein